ncbi:hypothetical protein, partial [Neoroseomonas lacus]|uniref:hypothetical protein n=1 Tax=Neoroseomonas lacus TaxID=287609 RepID=UPI0016684451
AAMPENVEHAIVPDPDGASDLLRRRNGYYNTVVLLAPERDGLPTGTKEALEGALAGAILIDMPCRHDVAA